MKICTVIGARPQFIKASALSALIEKDPGLTEVLIHTGQHSDSNLSAVFFEELGIPEPEYNLGLTGLSHAVMTGRMMEQMENILVREKPDAVVLYGDTNSTLAGALAASKLHIPVAHIEAGLRSYNRAMPEELNRIITDRLSQFLFTPSENASANLGKEGMGDEATIRNVGDIMYDVFLNLKVSKDKAMRLPEPFPRKGENFGLLTLHRQENTDNPKVLTEIIRALNDVNNHSLPLICPMHPR
ncbi:MAG: UDP-N-acetyl glucosamine 2-epimerase, partial [Owenweeksia sp.]